MKFLRKLFRRKPKALLTYTSNNGNKIEVGALVCSTCKNYFFVARAELEKPRFCAYCGTDFGSKIDIVPGEAVEELIV